MTGGWRAQSIFWITSIGTAVVLSTILVAPNRSVAAPDGQNSCHATGQPCFLGVDPDIYQMPLFGEIIQSGDRQICATKRKLSPSISCAASTPD
jgi:hypothetical protein